MFCFDSTFNDNHATYGGAIFSEDRNSQTQGTFPIIKSSIFANNIADNYGGALLFFNGVVGTLIDNIFLSNHTNTGNGGAIALIKSELHDDSSANMYSLNVAESENDVYDEQFHNEPYDQTTTYNISDELMNIYNMYNSNNMESDISDSICFADANNTNSIQNGMTWNTAYNQLQECIDALQSNGGEIWVKYGVYTPSKVPNVKILAGKTADIHKSFVMYDNIRIYGGFDGTETVRDERNFYKNPTYLSCNLNNNIYCNQILMDLFLLMLDLIIIKED